MDVLINMRRYRILGIDLGGISPQTEAGVVATVRDGKLRIVAGWSRDGKQVHVLEFGGEGEWRGVGLEETISRALEEIHGAQNHP
jgi:hypothetical protein